MASSRSIKTLSIGLLLLSGIFYLPPFSSAQHIPSARRNLSARIEAGQRIFLASCSMSYCHGAAGVGGGGPKLKDRKFSARYLTMVTADGIPDSAMPAFKNSLSKEQIADVVVYMLSLGPDNAKQLEELRNAPAEQPSTTAPTPAAKPPASSSAATPLRGNAAAGRELFFAKTELQNCRVCHTFQGKGGKVGPDLTSIGSKSAQEITQSISAPRPAADEKYATWAVSLRDGARYVGIKRDEDAEQLRLYDTSSLPPVSRAFLKTEVAKMEKLDRSPLPGHYGAHLTAQQLDDLVAFLKSGGGN